jgi:hypothetical protein
MLLNTISFAGIGHNRLHEMAPIAASEEAIEARPTRLVVGVNSLLLQATNSLTILVVEAILALRMATALCIHRVAIPSEEGVQITAGAAATWGEGEVQTIVVVAVVALLTEGMIPTTGASDTTAERMGLYCVKSRIPETLDDVSAGSMAGLSSTLRVMQHLKALHCLGGSFAHVR